MILRWMITSTAISMFVHSSGSSPSPGHHRITTTPRPDLQFQQTGILPKERQMSLYLKKNDVKRFSLISEEAGFPLSISITPCSSRIQWSIYFSSSNTSIPTAFRSAELLKEFRSGDLETYMISSRIGQYITEMKTLHKDTHVQIFASTEPDPPHETRVAQRPKVRFQPRQRRRITVKWDQSLIDPQVTEYCLVVNSRRNYTSLCGARSDKYGPDSNGPGIIRGNTSKIGSSGDPKKSNDLLISCVGPRTHHTVENLEQGKTYYFNIFAVNKQNNLTFPYGSGVIKYDKKIKHTVLKDGRIENINLGKFDGKAVFRFKAGRQTGDSMLVSIIPCGGAVDVEILFQGMLVANRSRLSSYGQLVVPSVHKGQRYLIKIIASNREELSRTSGVEVLATTKKKLPLPELPSMTEVREFPTIRNCSSVTVGWMPSPDPKAIRYCIVAKELRRKETKDRLPNQCALETRLKKSAEYNLMRCRNIKSTDKRDELMTENITGLRPDRRYVVQVTVKKSGGRTLSYDLLTVQTTSKCL